MTDPHSDTAQIDRYAVFGNPIAHSKSPLIHRLFARQTGQELEYTAIEAGIGHFDPSVRAFLAGNGRGLNVTVPFKEDAWRFADTHSARAERAGAVNTLIKREDGTVYGDTTDGVGLVTDLTVNHGITLADQDILVIGAGGAVRGVLEALLSHQPASLFIANRTASRASALAADFSDMGNISGGGLDDVAERRFDVIINGTSASLQGELPDLPATIFAPGACSYDMMYAAEDTPFMTWSRDNGASRCFDGLGMLVEQAAESFYLWRGVRPETASVITAVRDQLKNQPGG
jgi:shikimate dehydrogenase